MRKRLYAIFLALTAAIGISGGTVFGAAKTTQVDTITLETQTADDEVAVDLGWKTQQDKGRWIDKMGIADDVNSLVLIINNIENDTDTVKTNTGNGSSDKVVKVKRKQLPGNSRMLYLSRTENGVWQENFSVNCYISGAQGEEYVNLEEMRAFSNFGMILKPEEGSEGYPALVVNCQQSGAKNKSFCGIQLAQSYVRMLIQSMDSGTRIMIAGEVEELEGM